MECPWDPNFHCILITFLVGIILGILIGASIVRHPMFFR